MGIHHTLSLVHPLVDPGPLCLLACDYCCREHLHHPHLCVAGSLSPRPSWRLGSGSSDKGKAEGGRWGEPELFLFLSRCLSPRPSALRAASPTDPAPFRSGHSPHHALCCPPQLCPCTQTETLAQRPRNSTGEKGPPRVRELRPPGARRVS